MFYIRTYFIGVGKHTAIDTRMLMQVVLLPHDPVDGLAPKRQVIFPSRLNTIL